jgi:hypothetical protein
MSSSVMARGAAYRPKASSVGPTVCQPPSDSGTESCFPLKGQYVEAFRPACASCTAVFVPTALCSWTKSLTRRQASACSCV